MRWILPYTLVSMAFASESLSGTVNYFDFVVADTLRQIIYTSIMIDFAAIKVLPLISKRFNNDSSVEALMEAPVDVFDVMMNGFRDACLNLSLLSFSKRDTFIVQVISELDAKRHQREETVLNLVALFFEGRLVKKSGSCYYRMAEILKGEGVFGAINQEWKVKLLKRSFDMSMPPLNMNALDNCIPLHNEIAKLIASDYGLWEDMREKYVNHFQSLNYVADVIPDRSNSIRAVLLTGAEYAVKDLLEVAKRSHPNEAIIYAFDIIFMNRCPEKQQSIRQTVFDVFGDSEQVRNICDLGVLDAMGLLKRIKESKDELTGKFAFPAKLVHYLAFFNQQTRSIFGYLLHAGRLPLTADDRFVFFPPLDDLVLGTGLAKELQITDQERLKMVSRIHLLSKYASNCRKNLDREKLAAVVTFLEKASDLPFEDLEIVNWLIIDQFMTKEDPQNLHPKFTVLIDSSNEMELVNSFLRAMFWEPKRSNCPVETLILYWNKVAAKIGVCGEINAKVLQIIKDDDQYRAFESFMMIRCVQETPTVVSRLMEMLNFKTKPSFHAMLTSSFDYGLLNRRYGDMVMYAMIRMNVEDVDLACLVEEKIKVLIDSVFLKSAVIKYLTSESQRCIERQHLDTLTRYIRRKLSDFDLKMMLPDIIVKLIEVETIQTARYFVELLGPQYVLENLSKWAEDFERNPGLRLKIIKLARSMQPNSQKFANLSST